MATRFSATPQNNTTDVCVPGKNLFHSPAFVRCLAFGLGSVCRPKLRRGLHPDLSLLLLLGGGPRGTPAGEPETGAGEEAKRRRRPKTPSSSLSPAKPNPTVRRSANDLAPTRRGLPPRPLPSPPPVSYVGLQVVGFCVRSGGHARGYSAMAKPSLQFQRPHSPFSTQRFVLRQCEAKLSSYVLSLLLLSAQLLLPRFFNSLFLAPPTPGRQSTKEETRSLFAIMMACTTGVL
jgi:hypothetical protein